MTTEYIGEAFRPIFNAAMAAWWANDCKEVCPMNNWDCKTFSGFWDTGCIDAEPGCSLGTIYRFKPAPKQTVVVGYRDVMGWWHEQSLVAPETVAPEVGSTVWLLDNSHVPLVGFQHNDCTKEWLKDGELFLTREDAQAMSDWLAVCRRGGA